MSAEVFGWLLRSHDAIEASIGDEAFIEAVGFAAAVIAEAISGGGRILFAGNGGSAAQAQHFAAEMVGRFDRDRLVLPAIALGTDPATVTAIANDYGYDRVFERQLIASSNIGSVFVPISTSGKSPSILNAVEAAHRFGLTVIGMTGQPGEPLVSRCHRAIIAPATETPLIQQLHLVAAHAISDIVERLILGHGGTAANEP